MELDMWVSGCKVRAFPWIDGTSIYVNVQQFRPGQAVSQPPLWERTAYIHDDEAGRRFVFEFTHTLVDAVCMGKIPHGSHVRVG